MKIDLSRRSFLVGASALSFTGCALPKVSAGRHNLSFGVLSDIHITDRASTEVFRKTLAFFRDQKVDAVMIVGDMADHGLVCQLQNVADAWYDVFPSDRAPDGRKVEKLFVYGNHDFEGLAYRDAAMDKAFAVHGISYDEAKKDEICTVGFAETWKRCFHEDYEPVYRKRVRGYDFIGAHWETWSGQNAVEPWFAAHAGEIDTSKPFFFFQHQHPQGTVYAEDAWGQDAGQSTRVLSAYPNAVAFSGHSHRSLTDGRSYWRGEFTSIGTSTLSYVCLPGGRKDVPKYRANLDARQGQIVRVFDDRLEVERYDFIAMEKLDDDVVLPMPTTASTFRVRAVLRKNTVAFPAGAVARAEVRETAVAACFPAATAGAARPYDYKVEFWGKAADGKTERVTECWYQPDVVFSRRRAMQSGEIACSIPLAAFKRRPVEIHVVVYARNCYGGALNYLKSAWTPVASA